MASSSPSHSVSFSPSSEDLSFINNLLVTEYLLVAAWLVLFYDYILTISEEVELIWKRRWRWSTVIFLITRYLPFPEAVANLVVGFSNLPAGPCRDLYLLGTWLYFAGVFTAAATLILRTYAIWGGNKNVAIGLIVVLLLCAGITGRFVWGTGDSLSFAPNPMPQVYPGCILTSSNHFKWSWVGFLLLLVFETAILILTLTKIIYHGYTEGQQTTLIKTIYRDGLIFYILLFAASVANIVFFEHAPPALKSSLSPLHRVLHATLSARLILNIRGAARSKQTYSAIEWSRLQRTNFLPSYLVNGNSEIPPSIQFNVDSA